MNDRLSAVPFFEMVRTPNSFILSAEDNRPQRSSSVGNAFRRLFSKSPVPDQERSSSENAASSLGQQTPSPSRGRSIPILPLIGTDQTWETSTLPPNNPYYRPVRAHPRAKRGFGGVNTQASHNYSAEQVSAGAMASHRGGHPELSASGTGGSWRSRSKSATGTSIGTTVISEIPQDQSKFSPVSALPGHFHSVRSVLAPVHVSSDSHTGFDSQPTATQKGEIPLSASEQRIYIADSMTNTTPLDGIPKVTKNPKDSNTNIIVQYSVPTGTRYLPIAIGDKITMVFIGNTQRFISIRAHK